MKESAFSCCAALKTVQVPSFLASTTRRALGTHITIEVIDAEADQTGHLWDRSLYRRVEEMSRIAWLEDTVTHSSENERNPSRTIPDLPVRCTGHLHFYGAHHDQSPPDIRHYPTLMDRDVRASTRKGRISLSSFIWRRAPGEGYVKEPTGIREKEAAKVYRCASRSLSMHLEKLWSRLLRNGKWGSVRALVQYRPLAQRDG